jgi:uncharacterized protein
MEEIINKLKEIVKQEMEGTDPSHDFLHVMRVYNLCLEIAKYEQNVDLEVLKVAALLHDIARLKEDFDKTRKIDHAIEGAKMAESILARFNFSKEKIERVKECIISHRFRGNKEPETIEAKILFDADKLDVIGATGIARTFISVGMYKQKIYRDIDIDEYIKENLEGAKRNGKIIDLRKHSPNLEFETKFKYIPQKLYTKRGRELAKERIKYMQEFFERLKREINGEL